MDGDLVRCAATVLCVNYEAPQDPFPSSSLPPVPRRRPNRTMMFLLALSVVAIGVTAAVFVPKVIGMAGTFDMQGTLELSHAPTALAGCVGQGGYSDITGRDQVTVTDPSGKTVAMGQIVKSKAHGHICTYTFEVKAVPSGLGFYGVEVGKRGRVQYDEARVRQGVKLSLGS